MLIQCTKTLLDKLGLPKESLKPAEGSEALPESLTAWHANYITLDRRKAIILMNNETRYPAVNPDDVRELNLYQLKIEIEMEGYEIWRKVLVPSISSS